METHPYTFHTQLQQLLVSKSQLPDDCALVLERATCSLLKALVRGLHLCRQILAMCACREDLLGGSGGLMWGFPKIRGTILAVLLRSILVLLGLYWGPPIVGKLPYDP